MERPRLKGEGLALMLESARRRRYWRFYPSEGARGPHGPLSSPEAGGVRRHRISKLLTINHRPPGGCILTLLGTLFGAEDSSLLPEAPRRAGHGKAGTRALAPDAQSPSHVPSLLPPPRRQPPRCPRKAGSPKLSRAVQNPEGQVEYGLNFIDK